MAKKPKNTDIDASSTDNPEEDAESTQITLQQVAQVVDVIDLCSTRGAFKGEELEVVGQLRNAYARFFKANAPQESPTSEETGETSDTE
tara:strand:- start:2508 stop:2774 length:267 start_codon:yes stop_codon:yes gene_type:complete